jgi:hypothetical protein
MVLSATVIHFFNSTFSFFFKNLKGALIGLQRLDATVFFFKNLKGGDINHE